jgi:hypothetical protein
LRLPARIELSFVVDATSTATSESSPVSREIRHLPPASEKESAMRIVRVVAPLALVALLSAAAYSLAAAPKVDHGAMKEEHTQAAAEHEEWLVQISKQKVEHRRALAALAEIQARIFEHEATLEELAEHARRHETHIHDHEHEIAEHEAGGEGEDHAALARSHAKFMNEHEEMSALVDANEDQHDKLMAELTRLADALRSGDAP